MNRLEKIGMKLKAREVIAAQKVVQKQVAADHLFSKELQRKERAQEKVREATRINQQRMILDRQIQEETRKEEYFQLKSRNKSTKTTVNVEEEVDHMVSPAKLSSTF